MEVTTHSEEETEELAKSLAPQITQGLVLLEGPLGSGKTTFVRGFVKGKGINATVQSPSFQIHRQYGAIHHFDLYRIKEKILLEELGINELLDGKTVILIEWPEKLLELPYPRISIQFTPKGEIYRSIRIEKQASSLNKEKIKKAAQIIQDGGIVIFPTDTLYGMGCRVDVGKSVERLFTLKKRPWTMPVPVLVKDKEQALMVVEAIPANALALIRRHWPGALTIILPAQTKIFFPLVLAGGTTVGVRMPNNSVTQALLAEADVPIIGTSANFHGHDPVSKYEDLNKELAGQVDCILYGASGLGVESTIVDCTKDPCCIVRQGAVSCLGTKLCDT